MTAQPNDDQDPLVVWKAAVSAWHAGNRRRRAGRVGHRRTDGLAAQRARRRGIQLAPRINPPAPRTEVPDADLT